MNEHTRNNKTEKITWIGINVFGRNMFSSTMTTSATKTNMWMIIWLSALWAVKERTAKKDFTSHLDASGWNQIQKWRSSFAVVVFSSFISIPFWKKPTINWGEKKLHETQALCNGYALFFNIHQYTNLDL